MTMKFLIKKYEVIRQSDGFGHEKLRVLKRNFPMFKYNIF
jgi:hypothetical protein